MFGFRFGKPESQNRERGTGNLELGTAGNRERGTGNLELGTAGNGELRTQHRTLKVNTN
jgi:hypothetical protein